MQPIPEERDADARLVHGQAQARDAPGFQPEVAGGATPGAAGAKLSFWAGG